jgi:type I restriction enzyme S subunit
MTDAIDLTTEQRNTLSDLLRWFLPGVAVWAYGSRVKWTARPNSDLDLVAFATPAQRPQVADLKEALAESNLPFPVDLHVWDDVPERFREIIRKEYVVVQGAKEPGSGSGGLDRVGETPIEYDLRWPVVSLTEIALKIGSGATPKGGADAYLPSRARFALVRSQNVFDRRFDYNGLAFISDEQADGLRGVILQPDDILLNITGDGITFGRACMVPKDVLPACVNQHVSIIRLDPQRADAGYVLAFLTHPKVKSYIESFNAGGSRRAVTKGHIDSFRLPLPPLAEQRAIAHILGALDDKIELNRRMNETLEAMARALFKSWFIDFDPVRAKAAGRDSGLPNHIADLFPDSFEDSELGEIPRGWAAPELREVLTESIERIGEAEAAEYSSTNAGLQPRSERFKKELSRSSAKNKLIRNGYLVFGLSRRVLNFGLMRDTIGSVSSAYKVFAVDKGMVAPDLLERLMRLQPNYFYNAVSASSREGQSVSTDGLGLLRFAQPAPEVQDAFYRITGPLGGQINALQEQSQSLAALRDTLLPKLISGELRVEDAARFGGGSS